MLTLEEIYDAPVKESEHYLVKSLTHSVRCLKCGGVGEAIRPMACSWATARPELKKNAKTNDMGLAETVVDKADKAEMEKIQEELDCAITRALQEEEKELLKSMNLMQELEQLELEEECLRMELEEQQLQEALALSLSKTPESSQSGVVTDAPPEEEKEVTALKRESELLPPLPASKRVRHAKNAKRSEDQENPFDHPPDADQRTIFDLKGFKVLKKSMEKPPTQVLGNTSSPATMHPCNLSLALIEEACIGHYWSCICFL